MQSTGELSFTVGSRALIVSPRGDHFILKNLVTLSYFHCEQITTLVRVLKARLAACLILAVVLSSGSLITTRAYSANDTFSKPLAITLGGTVVGAGNQTYGIEQSGPTLEAVIDGSPLVSTHLVYTMNAEQLGLKTIGSAKIALSGAFANGTRVVLTSNVLILGSVFHISLPFGCSACTSEVPAAFSGVASDQVTTQGRSITRAVGMVLESAYFDPFGDAITIASTDNSIVILTNYTGATIDWSGVVDAGVLKGTLGTTPISGDFVQIAQEHENLLAGTASDHGVIAFSNVVDDSSGTPLSFMDGQGTYAGTSFIPRAGSSSCGITCTETGFYDAGSFQLSGGALVLGSYSTDWTVPALAFASSVTGVVI